MDAGGRSEPLSTAGEAARHGLVVETHVSRLFLTEELVVKVKKPVRTGFLDFSTRARRERACAREVELNRRLSPAAYLGVAHVPGPDGRAEPAVVMRRQPARWCLERLAREGADLTPQLTRLARLLAAFHALAERSRQIDRAGSSRAVSRRWRDNAAQLRAVLPAGLDPALLDDLDARATRFLKGRGPLLTSRVAAGRICDGHGDLLASDIFCPPDGPPQVLDCLEFDDRLRHGDVLADIAFLAMSLEQCGRPDAAVSLLAAYREETGDDWPPPLEHFYVAHRATIRAKVSGLRVQQGDATAVRSVRQHLEIARTHLACTGVHLVLVGGLPGTGKTTLARRLADSPGWTYLSSDVRRKDLAGLMATVRSNDAFGVGLYDAASTTRTYRSMLETATADLSLGRSVVLDATWAAAQHRSWAASVAARAGADLHCLQTALPGDEVARRLRLRAEAGTDASDADLDVHHRMSQVFAPWPVPVIDMRQPLDDAVAAALSVVGRG